MWTGWTRPTATYGYRSGPPHPPVVAPPTAARQLPDPLLRKIRRRPHRLEHLEQLLRDQLLRLRADQLRRGGVRPAHHQVRCQLEHRQAAFLQQSSEPLLRADDLRVPFLALLA